MSKNTITIQNAIEEYKKYAIEYGNSLMEKGSDYKITNKAFKKMAKLFNKFRNERQLADGILSILIRDEDIRINTFAAAHCLALKIYVQEAEEILRKASKTKNTHLLSFDAEKTLDIWNKQGYLNLWRSRKNKILGNGFKVMLHLTELP